MPWDTALSAPWGPLACPLDALLKGLVSRLCELHHRHTPSLVVEFLTLGF